MSAKLWKFKAKSELLVPRNVSRRKKKLRKINENDQVSNFEQLISDLCADNVNRELYQLLGDLDPQMVPVEEMQTTKTEDGKTKVVPKLDRPVDKWVWHSFKNPAREDGVQMSHWMKEKEIDDPYPFARFNKKARVITYTEEEYKKAVQPMISDWDKLETDVLFDLCQRFNMRFIVIADRFTDELQDRLDQLNCVQNTKAPANAKGRKRDLKAASKRVAKDRTVDELKDRYFSVAAKVLTHRGEI